MKTMKVRDYVRLHPDEFPSLAKFFGVDAKRNRMSVEDYNYTLDDLRDKFDAPYGKPSMKQPERKTIAEFDFGKKVVKLMKLNPKYTENPAQFKTIDEMYSAIWNRVLRSPKLCGVTFIVGFYGQRVKAMIQYCEMMNLAIDIITPGGKFHTSREYQAWYHESETAYEEFRIASENIKLMAKEAPELLKFAKVSNDLLIEVLRQQISRAGYDVSMYSIFTTDGLNSGKIDDSKGIHEWSRTYTKHYERYNETLKDLLMMYINCKWYAKNDIAPDKNDGINRDDFDSYTGASLTTTTTQDFIRRARMITMSKMVDPHTYSGIDFIPSIATLDALEKDADLHCMIWNLTVDEPEIPEREDVVVPRSACGLGLQNYMN